MNTSRIVNRLGYVIEVSRNHDASCSDCTALENSVLASNLHIVMLLNESNDTHHIRLKRVGVDMWGGTTNRFINTNQEGR